MKKTIKGGRRKMRRYRTERNKGEEDERKEGININE